MNWKRNANAPSQDSDPLQTEIDMAIARGIEKGIEAQFPEAKKINEELSFYGRLSDALEKKAAKKAAKAEKRMIVKDWKRIIAKEWLILITLTVSLPLAGYGLFLYQNRLYEKEQATIKAFNPSGAEIDAYLKSKEQRRLSEMSMEELQSLRAQHQDQARTDPYAHLSTEEIKQRLDVIKRKKQQLLLEKQQQARTEMLAKLIPDKRSEPSIQSHLLISVVSIPFIYLCLAILRITYWSLTTVRRPLQIQVGPSRS